MKRALFAVLAACGGTEAGSEAMFPADYAASYVEVRDCRRSGDHDLHFVRILVEPAAEQAYQTRAEPFAPGALIVKEEFAFDDDECAVPIEWTVMRKAPDANDLLGWEWQRVDANRVVVEENTARCYGCHEPCGMAGQVGYDRTCAEP